MFNNFNCSMKKVLQRKTQKSKKFTLLIRGRKILQIRYDGVRCKVKNE